MGDANLGNLFVVSVSSGDDDERMMWRLLVRVGEREIIILVLLISDESW